MTISLEMAVPALIGVALDRWLGFPPVLVIVGAILGLIVGMWHLVRMTQQKPPSHQ